MSRSDIRKNSFDSKAMQRDKGTRDATRRHAAPLGATRRPGPSVVFPFEFSASRSQSARSRARTHVIRFQMDPRRPGQNPSSRDATGHGGTSVQEKIDQRAASWGASARACRCPTGGSLRNLADIDTRAIALAGDGLATAASTERSFGVREHVHTHDDPTHVAAVEQRPLDDAR